MKNYIIVCDAKIENELVQIKILAKGFKWSGGCLVTQHTNMPVLIFDDLNNTDRSISYHESVMDNYYKKYSCYQKHITINASDFLLLRKF